MSISYGPSISTDSLRYYIDAANPKCYPGSGSTVTDLSGSGRQGTLTNISFTNTNGGSFDFGSNPSLSFTGNVLNVGAFTVEAFVKTPSINDINRTYYALGNGSSNGIWFFKHRIGLGNKLVLHAWDGVNPRVDVISTDVVPDNIETHVAATFNGNQYQLYINGSANGNAVTDNAPAATSSNEFIGAFDAAGNNDCVGSIYSLKIYDRALSSTEIAQNFNASRARFGI